MKYIITSIKIGLILLFFSAPVYSQNTESIFSFKGADGYVVPSEGWTRGSKGAAQGGKYIKLDGGGSLISPLYYPFNELCFKYDIARYGAQDVKKSITTLYVLDESNKVRETLLLEVAESTTDYLAERILNIGSINYKFRIVIEGTATRLRNISLAGIFDPQAGPTVFAPEYIDFEKVGSDGLIKKIQIKGYNLFYGVTPWVSSGDDVFSCNPDWVEKEDALVSGGFNLEVLFLPKLEKLYTGEISIEGGGLRVPVKISLKGEGDILLHNNLLESDEVKIYSSNGIIHVQAVAGIPISLYDISGRSLGTFITKEGDNDIVIPESGVVFIRVYDRIFKVFK